MHAFDEAPQSGAALMSMFQDAVPDDAVAALVKEAWEGEIVKRLAGGRYARRRAAAFSSVLVGLIGTRCLLRLEPVGSMSREEVNRLFERQLRLALGMPPRRLARPV
ncbi:hypothetical protein [Streptomyces sp. NRRL S-1022]|uniref:TetR/AcrR family transcriptional regulator n=1 Tax=Streptomyces sp. NRRL S-1022 TaxID=1463880 RepID=UPI00068E32F8|nr:hypothetical protein [Streptomyces sp. NRRL S-1022]